MGNENIWVSDGPCPFLFCREVARHAHPVCPSCGAARYGNMFCQRCREGRQEHQGRGDLAITVALGPRLTTRENRQ